MSQAELAAQNGLHRVGGRPPLGRYLREVWQRREFISTLARFRIEAENGRNRLGMGWVVLKPLTSAAVYGLIFGILLRTSRGVEDYLAFLVIGVMMFEFFASCLTTGAKSITTNTSLVQSLSFPRMALPLAIVTQRFLQFVPMLAIMLIPTVWLGNYPTWEWLLMLPLVLIFTIFNTGVALITARLTVHLRDMTQLLPFLQRLIFYSSGIFWNLTDRLADRPGLLAIFEWTPVHAFVTLARDVLMSGPDYELDPMYWVIASVWAVATLAFGVVFFWAAEERYGRTD